MSAVRKCNGKALRPYPIGLDVRVYLPADLRRGRRGFESRVGSVGEGRRCQCSVPIVGTRALIVAAAHGHTDTVQALLDAGADVNAEDFTGWTALHAAAFNGDPEIVQLLLEHGAIPGKASWFIRSPSGMAEGLGHNEIVPLLKEAEARAQ